MAKSNSVSGLTIDQVDAITLEICHAWALTRELHKNTDDGQAISLFTLLERQLNSINKMVCDCQIGGEHGKS